MIKNNANVKKIVSNNKKKRWAMIGSISFGSLFLVFSQSVKAYTPQTYSQIYESLNFDDFDEQFIDIYENSNITINNVEYSIQQIYLKTMDDDSVHYIKAGENNIDLLNGTIIKGERKNTTRFRDSTIFYQMYTDGLITTTDIEIDNETLQEYADAWDKKTHLEVPDLYTVYLMNNTENNTHRR